MKTTLQNQLIGKYPKIFPPAPAISPSDPIYEWGIECHDGWYDLIDHCCALIQHHIDSNKERNVPQVVAVQMKQKMGRLCFYYDGGDAKINGIVQTVEYLSTKICEHCGTNQKVTLTKGSIVAICQNCLDARNNRKYVAEQYEFKF